MGRIVGLFGVRGWVKVFSYTDPREAILSYEGWLLGRKGDWKPAEVAEGQRHGKSVIAHFVGVDDRDRAAALVGSEIAVLREALPETAEGQYYWLDLIGLRVMHRDGTDLGEVQSMLQTGANDVMVVQGEQERLIPFVKNEVVISVDMVERIINVDWEWD
jgi:16S rRNA processing protein RimM